MKIIGFLKIFIVVETCLLYFFYTLRKYIEKTETLCFQSTIYLEIDFLFIEVLNKTFWAHNSIKVRKKKKMVVLK